jgi:hypothetical protein
VNRSGKTLASYPAGQFFTAIADCASGGFSFSSLAALLLNRHLPWKDKDIIQELIDFGIKNNCISSWTEYKDGKEIHINVWEDAFANPFGGYKIQTRQFFADVRRMVNAMRRADSFSEIRKQYFIFRERFFDMENVLEETDLVLSRCISALMYLCEIEKSFPDVHVPAPYNFFTGYLDEENYLAQQSRSGVTILPYRTAAPAPFDCHIVLGASQDNLETVFTPLSFLPGNKREKLGIAEHDASEAFINLHRFNSRLCAAFFCSQQTFSGYAIPHSSLNAALKPQQRYGTDPLHGGKFANDFYREENDFYRSLRLPQRERVQAAAPPPEIHRNQMRGFVQWQGRNTMPGRTRADDGFNSVSTAGHLPELIKKKFCKDAQHAEKLSVSPSSLEPYFQCCLKWVFERLLKLENVEIETSLMADNITGQVYHAVINLFLDEFVKNGAALPLPLAGGSEKKPLPKLPETYRRLLAEKTEIVFETFPRLPKNDWPVMSMLTARLLRAEKPLFFSRLETFFASFLAYFAGCRVTASEARHSLQKDFYCLNGAIDCMLEGKHGEIIVDFKTKTMPELADCIGKDGLANFQLPAYLRIAEAAMKKEVHTTLFFSIIDAVPRVLFGKIENTINGSNIPKKEEDIIIKENDIYKKIMGEFDEKAEQFAHEISSGTFPLSPQDTDLCLSCDHQGVCRTVYSINRAPGRAGGNYDA